MMQHEEIDADQESRSCRCSGRSREILLQHFADDEAKAYENRECPTCCEFSAMFWLSVEDNPIPLGADCTNIDPSKDIVTKLSPIIDGEAMLYFTRKDHSLFKISNIRGIERYVTFIDSKNPENHRAIGRLYVKDFDIPLLNQWISECATQHHSHCHNPLRVDFREPSWLIDTHSKSLVPGLGITQFVALSHCWGNSINLETNTAKLELHRTIGSLETAAIPRTVRDAMKLAKDLGERYLWLDALCIVQDDTFAQQEEIHNMGAIYANATFVIIAADGDADTGLTGLRRPQGAFPLLERTLLYSPFNCNTLVINSAYSRRGWTFQEYTMAARRLIFYKGIAHWECSCSVWHEDQNFIKESLDTGVAVARYSPLSLVLGGLPCLSEYEALVNSFNVRHLTKDSDAHSAISDILSALSRTFQGGFLFGLPEMFFEIALLWSVSDAELRSGNEDCTGIPFPSWTWLRCKGVITFYPEGYRLLNRVIPTTRWYTQHTSHDTSKRLIRSTWYEYQTKFTSPGMPLPPGWSKTARGGFIFTDPSTARKRNASYPIEFLSEENRATITAPHSTLYISCKTHVSKLYLTTAALPDENGAPSWYPHDIVDAHGKKVGYFKMDQWHTPSPDRFMVGLVIIAGLAKYEKQMDHYFVMGVEWVDQVAYRKGIGEVKKGLWDKQVPAPQPIDLVLG